MSNFYDQGAYLKEFNLFYLSSRTTILLVWEKAPFSIRSIPFLFKVKIYNFPHLLNVSALISQIKLEEASTFRSPYPKGGRTFILFSLMIKCSSEFILERSGRYDIVFSDKMSSTNAKHAAISLGTEDSLFLEASRDLKF